MKVRLTRDARIHHKAGEIVDVSPAEMHFLTSVGSAVLVETATNKTVETAERATKVPKTATTTKRSTKK